MKVPIKPTLDKRLKVVQSIPIHVGIFIEPSLRQLESRRVANKYDCGGKSLRIPDRRHLAKNIEEMARMVFSKATVLERVTQPRND